MERCIVLVPVLFLLLQPVVHASQLVISWNGTVWAVLDSGNGSHLTVVTPDWHISTVPPRVNGTPCGLAWNGSEWLVETFVPDSVVVQTLNDSVLFRIHSYDCRGFAYLNGTYYVPISESAMTGDCSLSPSFPERKHRENDFLRFN